MKRRNWQVWAAGLALVALLAGGLAVTALWPTPNQAEQAAARIDVGMSWAEARDVVRPIAGESAVVTSRGTLDEPVPVGWTFADGSGLVIDYDEDDRVSSVSTALVAPDPPLARLRRTLARVFPFLLK
jgi:hypothetical protein